MQPGVEPRSEAPAPTEFAAGPRGCSYGAWLLLSLLMAAALFGVLKFSSFGRQRQTLQGGGTVELAAVLYGSKLTYDPRSLFDRAVDTFVPAGLRSYVTSRPSSSSGGRMSVPGSGESLAIVIKAKGKASLTTREVLTDGQNWSSTVSSVYISRGASGESIRMYRANDYPHRARTLEFRIYSESSRYSGLPVIPPLATFKFANPGYKGADYSPAPAAPVLTSIDDDVTFQLHEVVSNVSVSAMRDGKVKSAPFPPATCPPDACTVLMLSAVQNGNLLTSMSALSGEIGRVGGSRSGTAFSGTVQLEDGRMICRLRTTVPAGEGGFNFKIGFLKNREFAEDELWTVNTALPAAATVADVRQSTSVGTTRLEVSEIGAPGHTPPGGMAAGSPSSELATVYVDSTTNFSDVRLALLNAVTCRGTDLKTVRESYTSRMGSVGYSRGGGMTALYSLRGFTPETIAPYEDGPCSVTLTFGASKTRWAEFVAEPRLAK